MRSSPAQVRMWGSSLHQPHFWENGLQREPANTLGTEVDCTASVGRVLCLSVWGVFPSLHLLVVWQWLPRVASGDTLHTLSCLSSPGHFKRCSIKPALNNASVQRRHFVLGSPWVVSKSGLVEQKNREKAKYFSFFLGKGFGHKSNTSALAICILGYCPSSEA